MSLSYRLGQNFLLGQNFRLAMNLCLDPYFCPRHFSSPWPSWFTILLGQSWAGSMIFLGQPVDRKNSPAAQLLPIYGSNFEDKVELISTYTYFLVSLKEHFVRLQLFCSQDIVSTIYVELKHVFHSISKIT